jgi:glycosyltransferase involved in cell wall biosynthesis
MKKKLGLIFSYDEQWIGGTYYTINLIESFLELDEDQQPEVIVFSNEKDFNRLQEETMYPFLKYEFLDERPFGYFKTTINKISGKLCKKKLFNRRFKGSLDALFLLQFCGYLENIPMKKRIYWIPDFQDKHYPEFFTKEGLEKKDQKSKWIAEHAQTLILSSNAVYEDWKTFYPEYKCKVKVVHFAVTHPKYEEISILELRKKYHLPENYFFAPNQFWAHKNQMVVIKAVEYLKQMGTNVVLAFSGKENDNRNPGYTEMLKEYVIEKQLQDEVRFLGFLDRKEQLQLMKHALTIIQPSKFEGWSTVIEDAMAMNQPVIASSIKVNMEQLKEQGVYFDPDDFVTLSQKMAKDLMSKRKIVYNYKEKKKKFSTTFYHLIPKL